MTDIKKTAEGKKGSKAKKLQLSKETLKDLSAPGAGRVKGGANARNDARGTSNRLTC